MIDLEAWLRSIGLDRYVEAFLDNSVTADLLGDLTDADLKELGLNLGDRKRFLRAVVTLGEAPSDAPEAWRPQAERRRLTVMFVDLVGSTAFSSRMDPEEWSEVIRTYQEIVAGIVARYEGHVAQYLGDGMLCYFGWPRALEEAGERAVEAGLEIARETGRLTAQGQALAVRIGIATGLVVIGELIGRGDTQDRTAIGETPNLAARIQAAAEPGQVLVSESTRRLVGDAFLYEGMGSYTLRGLPRAQEVYAVLGVNPAHDRFGARHGSTVDAMVGRDHELALLVHRWNQSRQGEGQAVVLEGEAGIGKSRISRALFDRVAEDGAIRIAYQCSPYHRDTALWPVISQLGAASEIRETDTGEEALDRLARLLAKSGEFAPRDRVLLGELLNLPAEARYGALDLSPAARRAATFAALVEQAARLSRRQPVLISLEDAHWADPTTLELAGAIIERIEAERIMLLITTRPESRPALPALPHISSLTLNRLGRAGVEEIVRRLGGVALPPEAIEAIVARTDGVPLFVEELTKALLESGQISVPASLHDTLMARLDRLPEVKEVAQIASVIGREFDSDPLAQVAALSQQKVVAALENLRRVELVFPRAGKTGRYIFKHALVRDAAYESLLNRRRQEIHGRILDVLRESERTAPGILAHHAAEAGRMKEAVQYGRMAAEEALRRPAYAEAITHLEMALGILAMQPTSPAVMAERKRLLLLSGQARIAHYGYADESTVSTYAEIEAIARETRDETLLIEGLYGRWAGHYVPGRNPVALEIAGRICEVAEAVADAHAQALGHRLRGTVLTMMGRPGEAMAAFDASARHYDRERHQALASRFGQDVDVARKCYMTGCLALQGRVDAAATMAREILDDLEIVRHTHTSGYALGHIAVFLCAAEVQPMGREVAERCIELAERNRLPLWAALGHASYAMARVLEGDDADALPEFRTGLEMLDRVDFRVFHTILLPEFALALARTGDTASAAARLSESRGLMEADEGRFTEAEMARVEGQIAQILGDAAGAEAQFRHAIARAREMDHLCWELRAAEDLAALLAARGEDRAARELLAAVTARFREGETYPPLGRVSAALGGAG